MMDRRDFEVDVCYFCGNATIGRDDQGQPFPHECVSEEVLNREFPNFNTKG